MRAALSQFLITLIATPAMADVVYHCRAYDGRTFFAEGHCQHHRAHITDMYTVPSGDWTSKLQAARAQRNAPRPDLNTAPAVFAHRDATQCQELDRQIKRIDDAARQPQPQTTQTRLAAERKAARDQQFRLGC